MEIYNNFFVSSGPKQNAASKPATDFRTGPGESSTTSKVPPVRSNSMRSVRSDSTRSSKDRSSAAAPPKARPIKVASESLAQRAKHSSEERIGKFRKIVARGQSLDDPSKRKSNSPQNTDSDKDSLRSARNSRSSSLSSEVSLKSASMVSRSKTASISSSASKKSVKAVPASKPEQLEQQPAMKKLFPRNPIQNLIKFYEASTERREEGVEEGGETDRTPVVLEDKVIIILLVLQCT